MSIPELISLEDARALVLDKVARMPTEEVSLLDVIGRVAAKDLASDIDISPFTHSSMDGFCLRSAQLESASSEHPVDLTVVAEIPAGSTYDDDIAENECVRIMTGAALPSSADTVVKYEIVNVVSGDGHTGSVVSFSAPSPAGSNIRPAGEEATAGEVIVHAGEVIHAAGVGFLAGCGITRLHTYARPRVALIATGSELVEPTEVPTAGKIRNSNSSALAACALAAGALPDIRPVVADDYETLKAEILRCTETYDFVVTSGGAANGDYDFIKAVVDDAGTLLMTTVNMRPGKAQTFGIVNNTPVFGLPGNPAAAYLGFEMLIRPALRKMQGYSHFDRPRITACLAAATKKKDTRRIFNRATLTKTAQGTYEVTLARNQSSGLFGPIQRSNCFAIMPEGPQAFEAGELVECILLDIPEEVVI